MIVKSGPEAWVYRAYYSIRAPQPANLVHRSVSQLESWSCSMSIAIQHFRFRRASSTPTTQAGDEQRAGVKDQLDYRSDHG